MRNQRLGLNLLNNIHHLDDKDISKISTSNQVIIFPIAETGERLRHNVSLLRILWHVLELRQSNQLSLSSAVKLKAVVSSHYQLLVVSRHIGYLVDEEVKLSKATPLSSHKHIVR